MEEIAGNVNIHMLVVMRAKELFAMFRDVREALQDFEGLSPFPPLRALRAL